MEHAKQNLKPHKDIVYKPTKRCLFLRDTLGDWHVTLAKDEGSANVSLRWPEATQGKAGDFRRALPGSLPQPR